MLYAAVNPLPGNSQYVFALEHNLMPHNQKVFKLEEKNENEVKETQQRNKAAVTDFVPHINIRSPSNNLV